MASNKKTKILICSAVLGVALWSMLPTHSHQVQLAMPLGDSGHTRYLDMKEDASVQILRQAEQNIVTPAWNQFRGAIDTEWA